jgi:hypothetical protein
MDSATDPHGGLSRFPRPEITYIALLLIITSDRIFQTQFDVLEDGTRGDKLNLERRSLAFSNPNTLTAIKRENYPRNMNFRQNADPDLRIPRRCL